MVHVDLEWKGKTKTDWTPIQNVVESYGDKELIQLALRGHGNQHMLRLTPEFTVNFDTAWGLLYEGLRLEAKLADQASIVLDGCSTGAKQGEGWTVQEQGRLGVQTERVYRSRLLKAQGSISSKRAACSPQYLLVFKG